MLDCSSVQSTVRSGGCTVVVAESRAEESRREENVLLNEARFVSVSIDRSGGRSRDIGRNSLSAFVELRSGPCVRDPTLDIVHLYNILLELERSCIRSYLLQAVIAWPLLHDTALLCEHALLVSQVSAYSHCYC